MSERLVKALERIADPRNTHFAGDARVVAAAALADHRAQAGAVPELLTHDQLTPMSRFLTDRGIYLTNETLRSLAALAPRTAAPTQPSAVPDVDELERRVFASTNEPTALLRYWWRKGFELGRQQGMEQPTSPADTTPAQWDASQIIQPGWNHVQQAFVDGAREARANPGATDEDFGRASDGYTKRVFEEVDPVSEEALRTESWAGSWAAQAPAYTAAAVAARDQAAPIDMVLHCWACCAQHIDDSAVASGAWRLAPLEPTREMDEAGYATLKPKYHWLGYDLFRAYYRAMIVAAPQPGQVAWARLQTIDDAEGRPIGVDEPEVVWESECPDPDPSQGWGPLYSSPQPARAPLTDERIAARKLVKMWSDVIAASPGASPAAAMVAFARAIEAAHGITGTEGGK